MIVLVVVAIIGVGYVYFTAQVTVSDSLVQMIPAKEKPELFEEIKNTIENYGFQGTQFNQENLENIEEYAFYTYYVKVKNNSFILMDTVEGQIVPAEVDVLQTGNLNQVKIERRNTGMIEVTILTKVGAYATREMIITYYLWGKPLTLRAVIEP